MMPQDTFTLRFDDVGGAEEEEQTNEVCAFTNYMYQ